MIVLTYTEYLQNSQNQSLALQSPLLGFHPILSIPPTLISSRRNSQADLTQTLLLYCQKHSASILHLWLRNPEACADFPQPCSLPECWDLEGGWVLSALNARSKCLWVQCWTSLPPRVNACQEEMLFIFGRLGWLRSFLKRHVKSILSNIFCM